MTSPPFTREKGQPPLWLREWTDEELAFVEREFKLMAAAYRKMQEENAK